MAKFSSAAWLAHDLGLAASLGGTLFGRVALQPSLHQIARSEERDLVSAAAWSRFSWINVASHLAFAVPWLVGRTMLTGKTVSRRARTLVQIKDALVIASVVTGVSSVALGRWLAKRNLEGKGPQAVREHIGISDREIGKTRAIQRTVGALGVVNMALVAGVGATTTLLAVEGNKSAHWSPLSRMLP